MARYHPYIDAVQWIGTNVTEIRQFVRSASGVISTTTIVGDTLEIVLANGEGRTAQLNDWIIQGGWTLAGTRGVTMMNPAQFAGLYELSI